MDQTDVEVIEDQVEEVPLVVVDQAAAAVQMAREETRAVQTIIAEEVIAAHQLVEAEAIRPEVQITGRLHAALTNVIAVEAEVRVQHQEATVVLPAMEGEPAEEKVALLQEAGEIFGNPANRK